jgi:signal peptide peptidase SppA
MTIPRHPLFATFDNGQSYVAAAEAGRVESCLAALLDHEHGETMLAERAGPSDDGFWPASDDWRAAFRPYIVKDGILQIPVKGVLLHDFSFAVGSWATGYVYIQRAFERGCEDFRAGNIKGIALICDSPGGMVAGCFDAVDKMAAAKEAAGVPVRGFAHEMAYSACYGVISFSDHIAISRTGGVGSIGVVTSHLDLSGMMEKVGVKRTWIFAGKHKVDGNSDGPLPEDVQARIQARIDELYGVFVSAVARGRGMEEQAVRDTEALTFTATQAVSNGLADSIGSLDDAVAAFVADLGSTEGDEDMSTQDNTAVDQAAHEAAVAAAREEGLTAGRAEGATTERELVFAIIDSDEGKARPAAARALAAEGGRTLDQATAFLAKLPAEQQPGAKKDGQSFEESMQNGNPNVGATGGDGNDAEQAAETGGDVLALAKQAGLRGF